MVPICIYENSPGELDGKDKSEVSWQGVADAISVSTSTNKKKTDEHKY